MLKDDAALTTHLVSVTGRLGRQAAGDCPMIRRFAVLTLLLVGAACAHTQETSAPVAEGRRVFQDQGCYGCHTVGATGTAIAHSIT